MPATADGIGIASEIAKTIHNRLFTCFSLLGGVRRSCMGLDTQYTASEPFLRFG